MSLDIFILNPAVFVQQFPPGVEIVDLEWVLFTLTNFARHDCASDGKSHNGKFTLEADLKGLNADIRACVFDVSPGVKSSARRHHPKLG